MLFLANILFLAAVLSADLMVYADQDYRYPATLEAVVPVQMHREPWREEGWCRYTGLMVPYTNAPASEVDPSAPEAAPAVAGYAVVLNQNTCGDRVASIERLGVAPSFQGGLLKQHSFAAVDAQALTPEQRPVWYSQVMARIERLAAHDAQARAFLASRRAVNP